MSGGGSTESRVAPETTATSGSGSRLTLLDSAEALEDLAGLPSSRLEALRLVSRPVFR